VAPPGGMRRSFRTHRVCAIPGVSPRAGIRCPVGALRTPHLPRASLRAQAPARGAPSRHLSPAPAPALRHRKTGESTRGYAAFLQNAPAVRHTPGFHPGLVYGAPLGHSKRLTTPEPPPPPRPYLPHRPHAITTTHRVNDDCFSSTATIKPSHTGTYPQSTKRQRDRAGASIGTSTS
jgi:hypothetical protein